MAVVTGSHEQGATDPGPATIQGHGIWEHLTVQDGLPDMKIECIAEDRNGYIWIGTHDRGATRYDGEEFVSFTRNEGLAGDGVYSIQEDVEGGLWFATNRGLTRYDGSEFEPVETPETCGFLWGSCRDAEGNLWFGLERRPGMPATVCRWNGQQAELIPIGEEASDFGESIHAIATAPDGRMWLSGESLYLFDGERAQAMATEICQPRGIAFTGEGLYVTDRTGFWVLDPPAQARLIARLDGSVSGCTCVVLDVGRILFGSYMGSLMYLRGEETLLVRDFRSPIQAILRDAEARVWVGTYGLGVYRCDEARWLVYGDDPEHVESTCLASDGRGRILVGTADGLYEVHDNGLMVRENVPRDWHGITAICVDPHGTRWLGLRNGCVARGDQGVYDLCSPRPGVGPYRIAELSVDPDALRTWYSCAPGRGVGYYDQDGKLCHYGPDNEAEFPLWVTAIEYCARHQCVYFAVSQGRTDDGLYKVSGNGSPVLVVACDYPISSIAVGDEGVFVGTSGGVYLVSEGQLCSVADGRGLPCAVTTCLHLDTRGTLWIGTQGGGVGRHDGTSLQALTLPGGAEFNIVRDIATVGGSIAWIATEGGLVRYSARSRGPDLRVVAIGAPGREVPAETPEDTVVASGEITARFGGMAALRACGPVTKRYRLVGESEWCEATGSAAALGRLDPGLYSLEYCGVDRDLNYSAVRQTQFRVEADDRDLLLREAFETSDTRGKLVGKSAQMIAVAHQLMEVAASNLTVLIVGETGTGKNVAAKALHASSPRQNGPFIQVNCGAITESLAESELFGHERGAFTGAQSRRLGKFQLADGGTLFLDEVGDLSLLVQSRLLHVLQDQQVEPVGSSKPLAVDVRIVAATNRDLASAIDEGRFRQDLWYRLNAFTIEMPPLRQRTDDVPVLARLFAAEFGRHLNRTELTFSEEALGKLAAYDWPGNVRELEHMVQRAVILARNGVIGVDELPVTRVSGAGSESGFATLRDHEVKYLREVLRHTKGVIQGSRGAAQLLGMNPSTLRSRLKKHGLTW